VQRINLDAASAPPLSPAVNDALRLAVDLPAADPGRVSEEARQVRFAIEQARSQIAECLRLPQSTISFTASLAETAATVIASARSRRPGPVLVSAGERASLLRTAEATGETITIPLRSDGRIDTDAFARLVADHGPCLVVCQWVNQETGAIHDLATIAALADAARVPLLVDGGAAGLLEPEAWMARAFYATDATGLGGPAGISMVAVPRGVRLDPLLRGGAQERNRRAGLEATILICGFGAAAEERHHERTALAERLRGLRDRLATLVDAAGATAHYGPADPALCAPDVLCIGIAGIEAEAIVVGLDRRGVAAHSGSSCASETFEPSPVLAAMGADADHSLRLSLSWATTEKDLERAASALAETIAELSALRSGGQERP